MTTYLNAPEGSLDVLTQDARNRPQNSSSLVYGNTSQQSAQVSSVIDPSILKSAQPYMALIQKYFKPKDVAKATWTAFWESGFGNKSALEPGSDGATGIFRIQNLAGRPSPDQLLDPETNIRYAASLAYSKDPNNAHFTDWGDEGALYNGKPFGALSVHPFTQSSELPSDYQERTAQAASSWITSRALADDYANALISFRSTAPEQRQRLAEAIKKQYDPISHTKEFSDAMTKLIGDYKLIENNLVTQANQAADQSKAAFQWYALMQQLPDIIGDPDTKITNVSELQSFLQSNSDNPVDLTGLSEAQKQYLGNVISGVNTLVGKGDPKVTQQHLSELLAASSSTIVPSRSVSIAGLSSDAIRSLLTTLPGNRQQLPKGLTADELRNLYGSENLLSPEAKAAVAELKGKASQIVKAWSDQNAAYDAYKLNIADPTNSLPNLKLREANIFQWTLQKMEVYAKNVSRPIAAYGVLGADFFDPILQKIQPFTANTPVIRDVVNLDRYLTGFASHNADDLKYKIQANEAAGQNFWQAAGNGFTDWETSGIQKMLLETVGDPMTYLGFGVYTKATHGIPVLGKTVAGVERGWSLAFNNPVVLHVTESIAGAGIGFTITPGSLRDKVIGAGVGAGVAQLRHVPLYTARQIVDNAMKGPNGIIAVQNQAIVTHTHGTSIIGKSSQDIRDAAEAGIKAIEVNPQTAHLGDQGKWIKGFLQNISPWIDKDTVQGWASRIRTSLGDIVGDNVIRASEAITDSQAHEINRTYDLLLSSKDRGVLSLDEAADQIAQILAVSKDASSEIKIILSERLDEGFNLVRQSLQGDDFLSTWNNSLSIQEDGILRHYEHPLSRWSEFQGNMLGLNRKIDTVTSMSGFKLMGSLQNWYARSMLAFFNFKPMNYLETYFRAAIAGGGWSIPVHSDEITASQLHLAWHNQYPLALREGGRGNLEIAIVGGNDRSIAREVARREGSWLLQLKDIASMEFVNRLEKQKMAQAYNHWIIDELARANPEQYYALKGVLDGARTIFQKAGLSAKESTGRAADLAYASMRPDAPEYIRKLITDVPTATKQGAINDAMELMQKFHLIDQPFQERVLFELDRTGFGPESVVKIVDDLETSIYDHQIAKGDMATSALKDMADGVTNYLVTGRVPVENLPRIPVTDLSTAGSIIDAPSVAYHGSGTELTHFAEGVADPLALYGPGVYLSSDPIVTQGYAHSRAGTLEARRQRAIANNRAFTGGAGSSDLPAGNPTVHTVNIAPNQKLLNLEKPMPVELADKFDSLAIRFENSISEEGQAWGAASKAIRDGKPGYEVYKDFKDALADAGMTTGDAGEVLQNFNDILRDSGFDGLAHTGGIQGGVKHQVTILFDESKAIPSINGLTSNDISDLIRHMADVSQTIESTADEMYHLSTIRGNQIHGEQAKNDHWEFANNSLSSYLSSADDHFPRMIAAIRNQLQLFPQENQYAVGQLLQNMLDKHAILSKARLDTNKVITDFIASKGRRPHGSEWDSLASQRKEIWDTAFSATARNLRSYNAAAEAMSLRPVRITSVIEKGGPSIEDVAKLLGGNGDELANSLIQINTFMPKRDFVNSVLGTADGQASRLSKSAEELGWTEEALGQVYDSLRIRAYSKVDESNILLPVKAQLDQLKTELNMVALTKGVKPETVDSINSAYEGVASHLETNPLPREMVDKAFEGARFRYEHTFTDYTNSNMFDAFMRGIFPFWYYQRDRWPFLARSAFQHPGLASAWGRYTGYTEDGYQHLPGSDLAFNVIRGTVLAGGLKSLYNQFPGTYEDSAFGKLSEGIDTMGRAGFYPGIFANIPLYLTGITDFESPYAPALSFVDVATRPITEGLFGNDTIASLRDRLFPSKFRTYYTEELASNIAQNRGVDTSGDTIRRKMERGTPLSDEETSIWNEAKRQVNGYQFLFDQTGIFKLDIENKRAAAKEAAQFISDKTGVSIEQQDALTTRLQGSGYRLGDIIPLSPTDANALYQGSKFKYWAGSANVLRPDSLRKVDDKIQNYWDEVQHIQDTAKDTGFDSNGQHTPSLTELDTQFRAGDINAKDFLAGVANINSKKSDMIAGLSANKDSYYYGIPITIEQRAAYAKTHNLVLPVDHPEKELLRTYQALSPTDSKGVTDWDKYFASVDGIINAMPSDKQQEFLSYLHRSWTPTQELYWQTNREFIRPYFNLHEGILQAFNPSQADFIRSTANMSDAEKSNLPLAYQTILGDYNTALTNARQRFRQLDPSTDAWLYYWNKTTSFQTEPARLLYNQIVAKFGGGVPVLQPVDMSKFRGLPPLPVDNSSQKP